MLEIVIWFLLGHLPFCSFQLWPDGKVTNAQSTITIITNLALNILSILYLPPHVSLNQINLLFQILLYECLYFWGLSGAFHSLLTPEFTIGRNGLLFYEWMPNSISPILNKQVTTSADEYYYVKVTQADGDEAISSPIYIDGDTGNQPPQVTLTSPESGAVFSQNATIYLTANSEDYDGSVVRVEFYNGTQKIGEDASSPYQFT